MSEVIPCTDWLERIMDYEIIINESGEYEVWTPDTTGGVLGTGNTEAEAKQDSIRNMEVTCERLRRSNERLAKSL